VATIKPLGLDGADEELRAVGVLAGVGHRENARASVLELEVLVSELLAVDGLAAGAGAVGEVTSLEHELRDDTVELAALVGERLARFAGALFPSAERAEVLDTTAASVSSTGPPWSSAPCSCNGSLGLCLELSYFDNSAAGVGATSSESALAASSVSLAFTSTIFAYAPMLSRS